MVEFFRTVTTVGTPIGLIGLVVGLIFYGYSRYLGSTEKQLELLPKEDRAKSVDHYLTRYGIDGSNLTRDQKYNLILIEMKKRHSRILKCVYVSAAVFVIALVLVVVAYLWRPSNSTASEPTKASVLHLRMKKEGEQIINTKEPKKGIGSVFEFTLSNSEGGLAIVDSIAVEVLDVLEDNCGTTQALVSEYKYEAMLNPEKRGMVPFGGKLKYGPSEVDAITVNLSSAKVGYDYFVRIVVDWYDDNKQEKKQTMSDVMVAKFPAPMEEMDDLSLDERGKRYAQQNDRVQKRLETLREKVNKD